MKQILYDESKFKCLGPTELDDNTVKIKAKLQKHLLNIVKSHQLPKTVHKAMYSTGLQRPQMYNLSKLIKLLYHYG